MSTAIPRNLETLDFKGLTSLQVQIDALKARRYNEAQAKIETMSTAMDAQLRERLAAAAKALGLHPQDVPALGNGKTAHKVPKPMQARGKSKVAPKYRNPDNRSETWSGRGRQPRWMVAKIKTIGGNQDQFKI